MKKAFFFAILIIAVLSACKKSETTVTSATLIQNLWQIQSISTLSHRQGQEDQISNTPVSAIDYFDFRTPFKLYTSLNNGQKKDTATIAFISDNQFSINGVTLANITTLTYSSFIFKTNTTTNSTDYQQVTYNLKR